MKDLQTLDATKNQSKFHLYRWLFDFIMNLNESGVMDGVCDLIKLGRQLPCDAFYMKLHQIRAAALE
jgi:hypothetical protein